MTNRKVDLYVQGLFQHGLELYDRDTKNSITKGVVNAGGAKTFFDTSFKTAKSNIIINHKGLEKAIKDVPVVVYSLNRIELDEEGKPVMVNGGYRRIYSGLMLYVSYANDGSMANGIRNRLLEAVPEVDLSDYIEVASKIDDPENKLEVLKELKHQNFARELVPLELHNCIFLALPSGAPGSNQFWTFQNNRTQTREKMSLSVTASEVETSDLPF